MKSVLFSAVVLCSAFAQASVQFRPDSVLPAEIKAEIQSVIAQKCPMMTAQQLMIVESETSVRVDAVDQGLTDTYYTSSLYARVYSADGDHSQYQSVKVVSMMTEANNGTHYSVNSVEGCN